MLKQVANKIVRKEQSHCTDIDYLLSYHEKNGRYPLFQQVLIETRTDCNGHCPFCPQHYNQKKLGIMTWDCYCRVIDQLCEIGYNGRVALMISNEPLLETRLVDMIQYAKKRSPRLFLDITTNGRLLNLEVVDHLFTIGLDNINVNDYRGDRDQYPDRLSPNLEPIQEAYSNNAKITFQKRRLDELWPNYGGNIPQERQSQHSGFCNFPFRKLNIAYDGSIILCCDDFMYKTSFGNVMERSLVDCWNDPKYDEYRSALLQNKRIGLCAKCNDGQDYSVF